MDIRKECITRISKPGATEQEVRDFVKWFIGMSRGVPWSIVTEKDVDEAIAEFNQLIKGERV